MLLIHLATGELRIAPSGKPGKWLIRSGFYAHLHKLDTCSLEKLYIELVQYKKVRLYG